MNWIESLSEYSSAVRDSSIKRLRAVPAGFENWRARADCMSFADTAQHLIDCDKWLLMRLEGLDPEPIKGRSGCVYVPDRLSYDELVDKLSRIGESRRDTISRLDESALSTLVFDKRYGREVAIWWVIVRGNLDHETHHRGQIAAWLRLLQDS